MKYSWCTILLAVGLLITGLSAQAGLELYVDSAPNRYGSPNWAPWWNQTKQDVVAGTFTNMRTGTYPNTLIMHPVDEIVYSWGDLGKRLHWIYWVPDKAIDDLKGNFEVKWVVDWDGTDWTYDWGTSSWALDAPEEGWIEPGSWENYESGVIGSLGFAWWAGYGVTDPIQQQQDLADLIDDVFRYQTYAIGMVRYRNDANSEWQYSTLTVEVVPEPISMAMAGAGIAGVLIGRRKLRKKDA